MLPIDYLPGAHLDFDETFDWYVERSPAAALKFSNALDAALAKIAASPTRYAAIDGTHRQYPVKRYPLRIVYRVEGERILIVAIAHAKREPGYWKERDTE